MATRHRSWLGLFMVFAAATVPITAAEWRAGTVADTRRVLREEAGAIDANPEVTISAARNEWESFQILVRSNKSVHAVLIEPDDLIGPDGSRLAARAATIYRQHQLEITKASPRNKGFKPGWYPDALIPMRHPITAAPLISARYLAAPFDLPSNQTHGFLIDLHIPTDARPGIYHGVYRVKGEGMVDIQIPVTLTVWDFTLPATPTLQTAFGSPAASMHEYYRSRAARGLDREPADWAAVEEQCAQLLSEHHINATPASPIWPVANPDGSFQIPTEQIKKLRDFIERYHVNAIQLPHPDNVVKDPQREQTRLRAWLKAWDQAIDATGKPEVVFYFYLLDEPNDRAAYEYVRTWGRAIREAGTRVKVLVVEQPQTQDPRWGVLHGSVDLWCPLFCLFEPEPAAQRQAVGESVWTYTALCQGEKMTPWWQTDFPLLHYRVPSWIAWRYRIRGLLY